VYLEQPYILLYNTVLKTSHSTEIIGGKEVPKHSMPYMVLVHGKNNEIFCGGALIAPKWVITAAHCQNIFMQCSSMKVLLGVHARSKNDKEIQIRKVKNTVPHPCFHNTDKVHDIMLLKLKETVKPNKSISTLNVPEQFHDVKSGSNCTIAGWGTTSNRDNQGSDVLMEVDVVAIDRKKCNGKNYFNLNPVITEDMLCAGGQRGKKDSCKGDSGGPLICNKVFRAITSFGKGCGLQKKPGVYTLLTQKHIEWIKKTIRSFYTILTGSFVLLLHELLSVLDRKIPHSSPCKKCDKETCNMQCSHALEHQSFLKVSLSFLSMASTDVAFIVVFIYIKKMKVVLGAHSRSKPEKEKKEFTVTQAVTHPRFDNKTLVNDLMLLQVTYFISFCVSVNVPEQFHDVKSGSNCTIAGWGTTSNRDNQGSDVLMEVDVVAIDRKKCNGKNYFNLNPVITQDMLCAGGKRGKKDSCKGDSGGPLICNKKFVAVASFGYKGCLFVCLVLLEYIYILLHNTPFCEICPSI
uniref:Peptidase S1 domain-containing protein n=1 Tax=Lepisosteus oculatus TaxID=7918 RepID=W5M3S4_LEPOC